MGYKTNLVDLDKYVRLVPSEYTLVAARSSTGKTAFAMQLAKAVEDQKRERRDDGLTIIFSAEMNAETLAMRVACGLVGVSLWSLQSGEASPSDVDKVTAVMPQVRRDYTYWIDESSRPTISHMIKQIARVQEKSAVACILFDYLELAGDLDENENRRIGTISRGLKALAKRFHVPVIGLSQFNRDIESRTDKRPRMSDIMYGGEREPDRIIALVRGEDQRVDAHVLKNRDGPITEKPVPLLFDGPSMLFRSVRIERVYLNGGAE